MRCSIVFDYQAHSHYNANVQVFCTRRVSLIHELSQAANTNIRQKTLLRFMSSLQHSWPWTALQPQLSPTRFWPEPTARGAAPSLQQHCGYDCCLWFVEWLFVRLEPRLVFSVTLRGVNRFLSRVPPPAEAAVPSRDCHGAHSAHCLPRRLAIGVCGLSLLFHISGNFAFALWSACLCLETMHRTTKATLTQSPAGVYLLNSCKMTRGGFSLKRLCR